MSTIKKVKAWHGRKKGLLPLVVALAVAAAAGTTAVLLPEQSPTKTRERTERTTADFARIQAALKVFVTQDANTRLPCPADGSATGANQGVQGSLTGDDCDNNAGVVPFRTLGLSRQTAQDNFGSLLTYIVDSTDVNVCDGTTTADAGDLNVDGGIGGTSLFALISHGPNRRGAFTAEGTQIAVSESANEEDNCPTNNATCSNDDLDTVRNTGFVDAGNGDTHFDDLVYIATSSDFDDICTAANDNACQAGAQCDSGIPADAAGGQVDGNGNVINAHTSGATTSGTDIDGDQSGNSNDSALVDDVENWEISLGNGVNNVGILGGITDDIVFLDSTGDRLFTVRGYFGAQGNDVIYASNLSETLMFGGLGNDYLIMGSNTSQDIYYHGGSGNDVIVINVEENLIDNGTLTNTFRINNIDFDAILENDDYDTSYTGTAPTDSGNLDINSSTPRSSDSTNPLPDDFPSARPLISSLLQQSPSGIHGGPGTDRLVVRSVDTYDFNSTETAPLIPLNRVRGIEEIDLRCEGDHTVNISSTFINTMSDTDTVTIYVSADDSDSIDFTDLTGAGTGTLNQFNNGIINSASIGYNGATLNLERVSDDAGTTDVVESCPDLPTSGPQNSVCRTIEAAESGRCINGS